MVSSYKDSRDRFAVVSAGIGLAGSVLFWLMFLLHSHLTTLRLLDSQLTWQLTLSLWAVSAAVATVLSSKSALSWIALALSTSTFLLVMYAAGV